MKKTFVAAFVIGYLLGTPGIGWAAWCRSRTPLPIEEAYEAASLIFAGKVLETTWVANAMGIDHGDGGGQDILDAPPQKPAGTPYNIGIDMAAQYSVTMLVARTWKDTHHRVK